MARNLLPDLFGGIVEHDELLEHLLGHYGGAQQEPDGSIIIQSLTAHRLTVVAQGEDIGAIEAGPHFDPADLAVLRTEIRSKFIDDQRNMVAASIAFSLVPVDGWYRAPGSAFQIVPAPPSAPRPRTAIGDHPFLLEFPMTSSPDPIVSLYRRAAGATRWLWFLNAVLT